MHLIPYLDSLSLYFDGFFFNFSTTLEVKHVIRNLYQYGYENITKINEHNCNAIKWKTKYCPRSGALRSVQGGAAVVRACVW